MKIWNDLTQNHATGHYVGKDVFKTISYVLGTIYLFVLVPTILLFRGVLLPIEVAIILFGQGVTLDVIKEVKGYNLRRTADGDGNALASADSVTTPEEPVLMPQVSK